MNKQLQFISVALFGIIGFSQAGAQTNKNWNEVNLSVVDNQIIPRYATFANSASRLTSLASGFCSDVDEESLTELQQSFHESFDAWQAIQHIQFGPITYFNWNYRLQYWPDDKGTGGRQLTALIAAQDQAGLALSSFARKSVGIQGFPALERLLFDESSLSDLQSDTYRCQVAQTIALNINEIASGVHVRWFEEFRATVANADNSDEFESAEDATIDFLKALVETVPKIQDQKLLSMLGNSFATSRVRSGESWRSERSLKNIKINMSILEQLFNGSGEDSVLLNSVMLAADVDLINQIFNKLETSLEPLPDSLHVALQNEAHYDLLKTLVAQLEELDDVLEDSLKNTDLYLGFNSLDGD